MKSDFFSHQKKMAMRSSFRQKFFEALSKWGLLILTPGLLLFWIYLETRDHNSEQIAIKKNIIKKSIEDLKNQIESTHFDGDSINEEIWRSAGSCEDQFWQIYGEHYNFYVYSLFADTLKSFLYKHLEDLYKMNNRQWRRVHGDDLINRLKNDEHLRSFHSAVNDYIEGFEEIYGEWGWVIYHDYVWEKTGSSNRFLRTDFDNWVEANYRHQNILGAIWQTYCFIKNIDDILDNKNWTIMGMVDERREITYFDSYALSSLPNSFYYTLGDTVRKEMVVREDYVFEHYVGCDLEFSINDSDFEKTNRWPYTHYHVDSFPQTGRQTVEVKVRKKIPFSNEYQILADTLEYEVIDPTIEFTGYNSRLISTHAPTLLTLFSGCSYTDLNLRLLTDNAHLRKTSRNQYELQPLSTGDVRLELTGEGIMTRYIDFQAIAPKRITVTSGGQKLSELNPNEINEKTGIKFTASAFHNDTELTISYMRIGHYSNEKFTTVDAFSHEEGVTALREILSSVREGDWITLTDIRLEGTDSGGEGPVESVVVGF